MFRAGHEDGPHDGIRAVFLKNNLFIYLMFGCPGSLLLHVSFSLVAASGGYPLIVVCRLLTAVVSQLGSTGFRAHRPQ